MSKKYKTLLVTAAIVFLFINTAHADPDDKQSTLGCIPVLGCTEPADLAQSLETTLPESENRIVR